ncbi:HAD-IB family hydrolase [Peptacetobacter hominis]|uniref:phosphoserine phosphatase n=1 Tax=Peptacetobacter hominis TaxID=2743610 RepID=A0A544QWJ1_9FIRM|nr:HAD-IB family hydrolase [Peptacetobacter hominis]TQQ85061.1 HAD-IB family hydrolase [Peptacetobacter hominis]
MKKRAAFFDIDGTLYRNSLMVEHFKKLIKYEIIDEKTWIEHARSTYVDWDTRKGDYDDYLLEVCNIYVESLKGVEWDSIEFATKQVMKTKADRVYKFTRERIKKHLESGDIVIFISGSPDFLVKKMAEKYGVTDYLGSQYIVRDGYFTGELVPMWDSKSKNKAIAEFVEKYNIDLSESYAYGDTHGDINMLRNVGHPVAINPTFELFEGIKKDKELSSKTEIVVERKDVLYRMNANANISQF